MPRWAVVLLSLLAGIAIVFVISFVAFGTGEEVEADPFATEPPQAEPHPTATEEEAPAPEPEVPTLAVLVRDGRPVDGIQRLTVSLGEQVRVRVTSDVADQVHVHGYDLLADVGPGEPGEIEFEATIAGRFEIELEDRHVPIAELQVRP